MTRSQREEKKLKRVERAFFHGVVARDPLLAVNMGLYDHASQVPVGSCESETNFIRFLRDIQRSLETVNADHLSPMRAVDLSVAGNWIRWKLYEQETLRIWERVPNVASVVGMSISQLLLKNYAPLEKRFRSITERMGKLQSYVRQSMRRLASPGKIFVEIELENLTHIPGFLHTMINIARENIPKTPFFTLHRESEKLQNILEVYANWLIIDVIPNCADWAPLGEKRYAELLRHMEVRQDPARLLRTAETHLSRYRRQMREVGRRVKRNATIEEVRETIRGQHPSNFDDILKFTRDAVTSARQFVVRSQFATIPQGETLYVIDTPHYLRHLYPFTAYLEPSKFDQQKYGHLCVTPGNSENNKLKEHNKVALIAAAIHEGYPGNHLRMACALEHPSLFRSLASFPSIVGGWPFYCEERVREFGYEDAPAQRFLGTLLMLRRVLLAALDVRINTGAIPVREAIDILSRETGMDVISAESEVRRSILFPGLHAAALHGKEGIKDLKKFARGRMKGKFNETFFHDVLLYAGSLPLAALRKELEWKAVDALKRVNPPAPTPPPPPEKK